MPLFYLQKECLYGKQKVWCPIFDIKERNMHMPNEDVFAVECGSTRIDGSLRAVAEHFAERWGRTVVLDDACGVVRPLEKDDVNTHVYIHFFSVPPGGAKRSMGYAKQVFYIPVPSDKLTITGEAQPSSAIVSGEDVGLRLKSVTVVPPLNTVTIVSPEGRTVAQVVRNHIYILFNMLHRAWQGRHVVFWEILEHAHSHLHVGEDGFSEDIIHKCYMRLMRACEQKRNVFLQEANSFLSAYERAALAPRRVFLQKNSGELKQVQETLDTHEKNLADLRFQLGMLERSLAEKGNTEDLSDANLGQEFEIIHRFKNVLGVKIDFGNLHIYTAPIEKLEASGEKRMLSQFEIALTLSDTTRTSNTFPGIRMREWGWRGPYRHPEGSFANTPDVLTPPCFGPEFAAKVHEALEAGDTRLLVHMCLHYLDSDNRSAVYRSITSISEYIPQLFYNNDMLLERTKNEYIRHIRGVHAGLRDKVTKSVAEKITVDIEALEKNSMEGLQQERMLIAEQRFVQAYGATISHENELQSLLTIPSLIGLEMYPDFLWAVFGPGPGTTYESKVYWFSDILRIAVFPNAGRICVYGRKGSSSMVPYEEGSDNRLMVPKDVAESAKKKVTLGNMGTGVSELYKNARGGLLTSPEQRQTDAQERFMQEVFSKLYADAWSIWSID